MERAIRVKLKEHLSAKGVSQKDFAAKSGLREATVSQLVNNKYDRVQLSTLLIVMESLEVTDFNEIFEIV